MWKATWLEAKSLNRDQADTSKWDRSPSRGRRTASVLPQPSPEVNIISTNTNTIIIIKPLDKNKSSWDWTEQFSCREWKSFHLSIFLVAILLPPPFSSTTAIVTSSFPSNLTNHLHPPISAFQASFTICETIHHHIHHSRHIATDHLLWRPDNQLPRTLVMIFNIWQHWINFLRFSKLPLTPYPFILGK